MCALTKVLRFGQLSSSPCANSTKGPAFRVCRQTWSFQSCAAERGSCLVAKGKLILLKSRTCPYNALLAEMKSPSTFPQVGMRERQSGAGRFHPGVLERRIQARPTKSEMPTARPSGSQNSARGAPKPTDFRREDRRSIRRLWVESMPRPTISWRHTTLPNLPSPRRFADVHRERVHSLPCWA